MAQTCRSAKSISPDEGYVVRCRHMATDREEETIIFFVNHNDKQYYPLGLRLQTNNCL